MNAPRIALGSALFAMLLFLPAFVRANPEDPFDPANKATNDMVQSALKAGDDAVALRKKFSQGQQPGRCDGLSQHGDHGRHQDGRRGQGRRLPLRALASLAGAA